MSYLHRKLYEASKEQEKIKKAKSINGFTFREIAEFENAIIEVHSICRKKFEETKNMEYATVSLDCLKAINDMEKLKDQIAIE